jgi:hypothetical protein
MRFSWRGLLLAPLLAPALFTAAMMIVLRGEHGLVMIPSSVISYGTTIFLFLPALFPLSAWRPMTGLTACLLGLALGALMFVPLTWMEWKSSGADSGPPTESFFTFFPRWMADPLTPIYPLSGLVTAGLYWRLSAPRTRPAQNV